jgi:glucose-1-phosphate cytidylyltransferase
MKNTKVIILAGGQGMRLREETEYRPKPMVEVGSKPLLWHIMKQYAYHGFNDFVICLGYKGDHIKSYFLNFDFLMSDFTITLGSRESVVCHDLGPEAGWSVTLAYTGLNAETGSRLKSVQRYVRECDLIMMTYGDGLANVDLQELVRFHQQHGRIATVTGVSPPSRFGELVVEDNVVEEFCEKPQISQGHINGGFFVFDQRVFDFVESDVACSFEREPLQNLAAEGQLIMYPHRGFWHCVDTMRDLVQLNQMWSKGEAPWFSQGVLAADGIDMKTMSAQNKQASKLTPKGKGG